VDKPLKVFGIVMTLGLAAACWLWAGAALKASSPVTVVAALGISLVWVFSIGIMMASNSVTPQGTYDESGTLLRPSAGVDKNLNRLMITGGVAMGLCFLAWPLGGLFVPWFPEDVAHVIPMCCGAAAVVFLWSWRSIAKRGGLSYLSLTPEGFEFPRTFSMKSGRWEDVSLIDDKAPNDTGFWIPMVFTMNDGAVLVFDSPGIYTPKGTALMEMVRFYWQHPEQRDELTDGRALQRLERLQQA
jgi:hypothetical protein